ncbi:MAG TPA: aromatic ring-hydroxylating dioxygenase subunit alpha [Aestuariivirgaceae bacterium]|nr:aromatic ring-hydroxylating dioxygenase subunit alpha [Aestuariivirgaceae bacterium]
MTGLSTAATASTCYADGAAEGADAFRLLPRVYYVSPEIFAKEVEQVFFRQWIFLGHASQVKDVGDYFLETFAGESLILVRESAERIAGYFNVCRHRGHPLCKDETGSVRQFTCPYHRWSYGLDGGLRRAPGSPDGEQFDYRDWGLHRFSIEVWNGFIFGWLSRDEPPSLASRLAAADGDFRLLETQRVKEAHRESYDIDANWKLLLENYLECYHCEGAHPELCVSMDVGATYANTESDWAGEYFSGLLQLRPGMKTGSMDGQPVSMMLGGLAGKSDVPDGFGAGIGIVPTLTRVIFHIDHGIVHMLRPVDVGCVRWETRWYVHEDAVEGEDYDVAKLTELWKVTNRQDLALCEAAYQGVLSRRFVSGPLDRRRETAVHSALQTYRRMMNASP